MAIIDTDDEDLVLLIVARVTERHDDGMHLDLRVMADSSLHEGAVMKMITDAGKQYLREKTDGQVGLIVMSPRQVADFIRHAGGHEFNPFGAPARGPARGWG